MDAPPAHNHGSAAVLSRTPSSELHSEHMANGGEEGHCSSSSSLSEQISITEKVEEEEKAKTSSGSSSSTNAEDKTTVIVKRVGGNLPRPLSMSDLTPVPVRGSILRVAYQDVPGAYSEAAAAKAYHNCEPVPYEQFEAAVQAMELWLADCAVLPVENSLGGTACSCAWIDKSNGDHLSEGANNFRKRLNLGFLGSGRGRR